MGAVISVVVVFVFSKDGKVGGIGSGVSSFGGRLAASFSSFGRSWFHEVILGIFGMTMARR